jgi:hypothetical protein
LKHEKDWTKENVQKDLQIINKEKNTLFDDLGKNLENNRQLYELIYDILIIGNKRAYSIVNPIVEMADMYGIIKETKQGIAVSNKIFELIICNYFISKDEGSKNKCIKRVLQYDVVKDGIFDMKLCLEKFAKHYAEIFNERDYKFLENHGRLLFISYLRPLINGQGFYHIESQFTDLRRMDLLVDFGKDQFIVELKIWHGDSKHQEAYEQLLGYMDSKNASEGYLLTFDFRKDKNKHTQAEWAEFDGRRIFDVVV